MEFECTPYVKSEPQVCCVCSSSSDDQNTRFYQMPTDSFLRSEWLKSLNLPPTDSSAVICSLHFKTEDFEAELGTSKLKTTAVPVVSPQPEIQLHIKSEVEEGDGASDSGDVGADVPGEPDDTSTGQMNGSDDEGIREENCNMDEGNADKTRKEIKKGINCKIHSILGSQVACDQQSVWAYPCHQSADGLNSYSDKEAFTYFFSRPMDLDSDDQRDPLYCPTSSELQISPSDYELFLGVGVHQLDVGEQPLEIKEEPLDIEYQPLYVGEQPLDIKEQPLEIEDQSFDNIDQELDIGEQQLDIEGQQTLNVHRSPKKKEKIKTAQEDVDGGGDSKRLGKSKQTMIQKPDFCYFCKDMVFYFSKHIEKNHSKESEVTKIFSMPKNSKERKKLFTALRKKGNYLVSSTKERAKPMNRGRSLKEATDFLPCSFCLGFYYRKQLSKHMKRCSKGSTSGACQGLAQNHLVPFNPLLDQKLEEAVFSKMRADNISLVAKSDVLICAFGARYLKLHKEKHSINVISRKMRELSRFLIEIKSIQPEIENLFFCLDPKYFDSVAQAVKNEAAFDEQTGTYEAPTYAASMVTSLKQCCDIALQMLKEQRGDILGASDSEEAKKNIAKMKVLLKASKNWKLPTGFLEKEGSAKSNEKTSKSIQKQPPLNSVHGPKRKEEIQTATEDVDGGEGGSDSKRDGKSEMAIIRKPDFCYFCRKMVLNFARHIERCHGTESQVIKILSKPKKSIERKKLFTALRKRGNYLVSSTKERAKPMNRGRSLKEATDFLPCSFCLGLYYRKQLSKHMKMCSKGSTSGACQGLAQNHLVPFNPLLDPKLKETVFPKMRADNISLVAKSDVLICAFGAKCLKANKENYSFPVISKKMRELSRFLIEIKLIRPEIENLFSCLHPKYFDSIAQAVKNEAAFDEQTETYEAPTYAASMVTSLKQCSDIALQMLKEQQGDILGALDIEEATKNIVRMKDLLESSKDWKLPSDFLEKEGSAEFEGKTFKTSKEQSPLKSVPGPKIKEKIQTTPEDVDGGEGGSDSKRYGKSKKAIIRRNICYFCKKVVTNFARHIERFHSTESQVTEILSKPKKSNERKKLFTALRKRGNYLIISNRERAKRMQIQRGQSPKEATDFLPCSFCLGLYDSKQLSRHMEVCSKGSTSGEKLKETVFLEMRADNISLVAKSDVLICAFGGKCLKPQQENYSTSVISQKMRELSRFLIEIKSIRPEIENLFSCLHPKYFDSIAQAVKNEAAFDEQTEMYEAPTYAASMVTSLKQCCDIALQMLKEQQGDILGALDIEEATKNIVRMKDLLESSKDWKLPSGFLEKEGSAEFEGKTSKSSKEQPLDIEERPPLNFVSKKKIQTTPEDVDGGSDSKRDRKSEKTIIRKPNVCYFCKNIVFNFARHIKRHHRKESEVTKILSTPKKSNERKKLFTALRKRGNYLIISNRERARPMRIQRGRYLRDPADFLPCSFCLGFYYRKQLSKHMKRCSKGSTSGACQGLAQNQLVPFNPLLDPKLKETVFPKMRADKISLVAKSDVLICALGARNLKTRLDNQLIIVISRRMRELSRLVIEIKKIRPEIENLYSCLNPKYFDSVAQVVKNEAAFDEQTQRFKAPTYATNVASSLKQCCVIALQMLEKQQGDILGASDSEEATKNITRMHVFLTASIDWKIPSDFLEKGGAAELERKTLEAIKEQPPLKSVDGGEGGSDSKRHEKSKKTVIRRNICYFCKKVVTNFARHIERFHSTESEVTEILSKPKKSNERKKLFTALRKRGNYMIMSNRERAKPMRIQQGRYLRDPADFLPCSFCLGFYYRKQLARHMRVCSKGSFRGACQGLAQNQLVPFNPLLDPKLKETVFPKMRADKISLVAKSDVLICALGARNLKTHLDNHLINLISRKMRELSRLVIEIKKIRPEIENLFSCLNPKHFDSVAQAVKNEAAFDEETQRFKAPTYATNVGVSLKQCCVIALKLLEKQQGDILGASDTKEATKNVARMIDLLTASNDWKLPSGSLKKGGTAELEGKTLEATQVNKDRDPLQEPEAANGTGEDEPEEEEQPVVKRKKRVFEPWTIEQKREVAKYFRAHIKKKQPPKQRECEALKMACPILETKSWLKMKVLVQNMYTKKCKIY